MFISLAYGVLSLTFFILALVVAWLSASLSFSLSRLAYAPRRPFSFFLFFPTVLFLQFSGLCSLFSFSVHSLGHRLLGFLLFCFCLSVLSDVYGVSVLRLPYFPWGFPSPFRVPHLFISIRSIFRFVFASLQFWFSLLLLLFHRIF